MRRAFVEALCQAAAVQRNILLLTGDLGYMALEPFRDCYPTRFFNVGVAEQNMIAMSTGLAEAGFIPYAYSIATFAALRPFEFIRNGPALHRLPVRIVGMGMGFEYGHAGPSHHAVEDVAVLRTLPAVTTIIPADSGQARSAIAKTWDHPGPIYYSLGKDDRLTVPGLDAKFELGRIQVLRSGPDLAIVSMGSVTIEAACAADELAKLGIQSALAVVSNFNPDPVEDLAAFLSQVPHVITVEAQALSGGLAALTSLVIASHALQCRLSPVAITTSPDGTSGSQSYCWRRHGLDRRSIVERALAVLGRAGQ